MPWQSPVGLISEGTVTVRQSVECLILYVAGGGMPKPCKGMGHINAIPLLDLERPRLNNIPQTSQNSKLEEEMSQMR